MLTFPSTSRSSCQRWICSSGWILASVPITSRSRSESGRPPSRALDPNTTRAFTSARLARASSPLRRASPSSPGPRAIAACSGWAMVHGGAVEVGVGITADQEKWGGTSPGVQGMAATPAPPIFAAVARSGCRQPQVITVGRSMPVRDLISARSSIAVIRSARATWGSWARAPLAGT